MELGGIEVRETICSPLYRTRLAEVAREALSVVRFVLSKRLVCVLQHKPIRQPMDPCLLP
jgi:hypothetical protein